jgi:hypothetical protein
LAKHVDPDKRKDVVAAGNRAARELEEFLKSLEEEELEELEDLAEAARGAARDAGSVRAESDLAIASAGLRPAETTNAAPDAEPAGVEMDPYDGLVRVGVGFAAEASDLIVDRVRSYQAEHGRVWTAEDEAEWVQTRHRGVGLAFEAADAAKGVVTLGARTAGAVGRIGSLAARGLTAFWPMSMFRGAVDSIVPDAETVGRWEERGAREEPPSRAIAREVVTGTVATSIDLVTLYLSQNADQIQKLVTSGTVGLVGSFQDSLRGLTFTVDDVVEALARRVYSGKVRIELPGPEPRVVLRANVHVARTERTRRGLLQ